MKTSEDGRDFDWAWDTLELPANASREAIEQAYNDLRKVWAPERFQADERLKRRAEEQLARIEEAYLLLRDYHTPQDPLLEELYGKAKKNKPRPSAPSPRPESPTPGTTPSLLDSFFADPGSRPAKRFPLGWLVMGLVVIVVLAILLVSRFGSTGSPTESRSGTPAAPTSVPSAQAAPPPAQDLPAEPAQIAAPANKAEPQNIPDQSSGLSRRQEEPLPSQSRSQAQPPPDSARPTRQPTPGADTPPAKPKPGVKAVTPTPSREPETKPELLRSPEEGGVAPEEERRVMNVLGQKSQAAQRILDGTSEQFRVMSWRVLKKDGGEFWAHLVAQSSATNSPTHFIWAVDPARETVRAMSQAARDLEKGLLGGTSPNGS